MDCQAFVSGLIKLRGRKCVESMLYYGILHQGQAVCKLEQREAVSGEWARW